VPLVGSVKFKMRELVFCPLMPPEPPSSSCTVELVMVVSPGTSR
jgi:hypothetical protein